MGVPRYTTPTFTLTFSEQWVDLTQAREVFVTFEAPGVKITKTGEDLVVTAKTIQVRLSQEETAKLTDTVEIQANWMIGDDRIATDPPSKIDMSKQLYNEVIL